MTKVPIKIDIRAWGGMEVSVLSVRDRVRGRVRVRVSLYCGVKKHKLSQ